MERKEIKKIITETLKEYGFRYNKKVWYYESEYLYIIVDLQKSRFGDYYYINYAIVIKEINPDINVIDGNTGDMDGRFISPNNRDDYEYSLISMNDFRNNLKWNIETNLKFLIESKSLKRYLEGNPKMLYSMSLKAKEYLGIKDI